MRGSGRYTGCAIRRLQTPQVGFLWTGELQQAPDFFLPWHVDHVLDRCPELRSLLELPPGSRFIYAPHYSDVWNDDSLLDI